MTRLTDRTRYPFFMVPNAVYTLPLGGYALAVYLNLRRRANNPDGAAFPSLEQVADDVKFSTSSVRRGLAELLEKGYIRRAGKNGRAVIHEIVDLDEVAGGGAGESVPQEHNAAAGGSNRGARAAELWPTGRRLCPTGNGIVSHQNKQEEEGKKIKKEDKDLTTCAAPEPAAPTVLEGEIVTDASGPIKASDVIREFSDGFARKFGRRPICTGQDAGMAKQLARKLEGGIPALRRAVNGFFTTGVGWWVEKNAYTFNVFISCYNQALAGRNGNAGDARDRRIKATFDRVIARRGGAADEGGGP